MVRRVRFDREGGMSRILVSLAVSALACLHVLASARPVATAAAGEGVSPADLAAFREARFGLFVHWGLYSRLGGRWKGEEMEYIGEWIQSRFRIPNAEYAKVAESFNPVGFDADDWARQAKHAGMEYVVFTTKHHDGFSMFATKASDFNIVDATPFKRDVLAELVAACRRHGLKVGLYYSQALDWHEFDAADPRDGSKSRNALFNKGMPWGNSWDWPDPSGKDFDRYLKAKVYPQIRELLTNYGDIFLLWFDCPSGMTPRHSKELKDFVHSLQPHVLVSGRIGNGLGDFGTLGDNQEVAGASEFPRETPMTLNDTWGFKYGDHNWKSASQVVCALANAVSCNANLLLNIGPRPDGRFPDAASDVLKDLGDWRKATGFEIRGTAASPFPQAMPWGWCTVAPGNVLQFVVRPGWTNDLEVCGIRNAIKGCSHPFEKDGATLRVRLASAAGAMPRVVKVRLDGPPDIDGRLMPQHGELVLLPAAASRTEGSKCRMTDRGSFTDWHHAGDMIAWKAYFPEAGCYSASLRTESWAHSRPWAGDRKVEVSAGANRLVSDIKKDRPLPHTVYDRADSDVGIIAIPEPGEYEVSVRTLEAGPNAAYQDLTMLRLVRATEAEAGDAAGSGLEVRHSPACLTDAGEISSSPVDTARYGVIFPMQIDADVVALFVNRGAYLGRVPGVERWNYDFEDGADVFLRGRVNGKVAVSRSSKEGERFVASYPVNGGFVPAGALLSDRPHPHAGSGFLMNLAYSHEIAKDGTFDWRTPGFRRLVEVRQARYDGTTLTVDPPATYDADRPLAIGTDGWCVHASGMSVAIPDGEDLLFPLSATRAEGARKAVGLARWRCENGVWAPVSFSPVAFNDGASEHSYTEPSVVRDAAGRLVFSARDDGRRDRSGAKPRTAYEQDLNAWISDDSGKTWRVLVHAEKMRTPGPTAVGRTAAGRIFLAGNPIPPPASGRRDYRGKLVLWPVTDDGRLGESMTICDANTEFGKNGAYWCVDHPTSTILRNADGTVRSVLAYRVRDPYFYPFRPGNVFSTPSRQAGAYVDEVRSSGAIKPIWNFEVKK